MSTYKGIFGKTIKHLSSDPDNSTYEGQIWYNTTEGKFKTVVAAGAWISSSSLIVARDAAGSAGTQTTATIFGGNINPGNTSATDEYNGSGFSSGGTLNTARRQTTGCGLQTAALCVGGYTTANAANVEEYNGTSWSEQNDIPGNYRNGSTFGTQTAALYVGGYSVPVPNSNVIQIYDGTNWTISPATLGTGGNSISSTGTSTAGLVFGGANRLNATEEWNGTAMSTGGNLTTSKYGRGSANQAPSENAMSAGGGIPAQTTVENYDGTTWSTLPSLAVATNAMAGAGTASAAMMMGGGPGAGPVFNTSTEFNFTANTITAAAWSSAPTLPETRYTNAGAGTVTAALNWGGVFPTSSTTAEYDGSSWSTGGAYPKGVASHGGTGLQTAALSVCGLNPASPPAYNDTFEYDGTSWGSPATYPQQGFGTRVWGIQTSAVATGGGANPAPTYNTTVANSYNGTSWTSETAFSTLRSFHSTGGANDTAGIIVGGRSAPGTETAIDDTEEYNGTSWTAGGDYITVVKECTGWGTVTDQMQAGGSTPSITATCAIYDGTAWATTASLPTVLTLNATTQGTFNTNSGFTLGGSTGSVTNAVSEFTPESVGLNIESVDNS